MSKKIQDYSPLYIGSECIIGDLNWKSQNIAPEDIAPYTDPEFGKPIRSTVTLHSIQAFSHKLHIILRPLSSMTEEEMCCASDIVMPEGIGKLKLDDLSFKVDFAKREIINYGNAIAPGGWLSLFPYLLSRHFDLFNLIPENLAIDSTTIKNP